MGLAKPSRFSLLEINWGVKDQMATRAEAQVSWASQRNTEAVMPYCIGEKRQAMMTPNSVSRKNK